MSQPKRRTALWTGVVSAVAALGLAPLPAHAQFTAFPRWGMPGVITGGPNNGAAQPSPGVGGTRLPSMMPGFNPLANGQGQWSLGTSRGSAWPGFTAGPNYGPSSFFAHPYGGSTPMSTTTPAPSASQSFSPSGGTAPGYYGDRVSRRGTAGGFYEADPNTARPTRPGLRLEGTGTVQRPAARAAAGPPARIHDPFRGPASSQRRTPGALVGVGSVVSPPRTGGNTYIYEPQAAVNTLGGPALLGGYYYGSYCDSGYSTATYPAVYSLYEGFPGYIYNVAPGVTYETLSPPVYISAPQPFTPPMYTVTYNQNNYYVPDETKAADIEAGGAPAKTAVHQAYPADTYQAAFADIERSWTDGNLDLLKKHLRDDDTKVSVFLSSQYKYSLNSSDFAQITRDAFDRLDTVSFRFTSLRKTKDGEVTAYGKHVYRVAASDGAKGSGNSGELTPFDASAGPSDTSNDGADGASTKGEEKTVYVAYTLRRGPDVWYIANIDSSTDPLPKDSDK